MNRVWLVATSFALSACSPPAGGVLPGSFSLRCQGMETSSFEKQGVPQPPPDELPTTIYYHWNDETKALLTNTDSVAPAPFCRGQARCTVGLAGARLTASSFERAVGQTPNSFSSSSEKIDVDLDTMRGMAALTVLGGTQVGKTARIDFKNVVTIPLRCKRTSGASQQA